MKQENTRFGKVAVLMGGWSPEREVSLMSGAGVLRALRAGGIDAHPFDPAERPMDDLRREGFARCFIALHGSPGEDGTVQGALELLGIPYTGAGVMTSSVAIDKAMTKRVWLAEGLPTPRHVLLHRGESSAARAHAIAGELGLPLIVKPVRGGSSLGMTKVVEAAAMQAAIEEAGRLDEGILCEQFIAGDEVTVLVLGGGAQARAMPVIRILAPEGNYDYQNKYFSDLTTYQVPCDLPEGEQTALRTLAERAYRALGCRGWGRIDLMIERASRAPWLLEINTSPGMTAHSLAPMAAAASGMSYENLCEHLLAGATLDDPRSVGRRPA